MNDQLKLSVHNHIDLKNYRVLLINEQGTSTLTYQIKNDQTIVNLNKNDLLKSTRPWVLKFEDSKN